MQAQPPTSDDTGPVVLYEKKENFVRITLNRPDVLNAINRAMMQGLNDSLDRAEADDEVRAIIITGAGRAFTAGGDLTENARRRAEGTSEQPEDGPPPLRAPDVYLKIWRMGKPVIAAIRGHAVGQGCEMMCMCDLVVASETARIGEPQIRHGGGMPMVVMPWLAGIRHAKELILTGAIIDAHEAYRMGLVNKVVPDDQLEEESENLARRLGALPAAAIKSNKMLINRVFEVMGYVESVNYQGQPNWADLVAPGRPVAGPDASGDQMRVLHEQGWEAWIAQRNQAFEDKR